MKRSTLFRLIGTTLLVSVFAVGSWLGITVAQSGSQGEVGVVKGASSTELAAATTISLAPYPVVTSGKSPFINARRYVLYHPDSGKVIVENNGEAVVPIASTTKIMTTFLVARIANLDDIVTVTRESALTGGSRMDLRPGERITVRDLLAGAMLVSGNDAAMALAEYTGQKLLNDPAASREAYVERFVEEMNAVAARLKMTNTHYMDPAGLNDEGQSTAHDLAKLATLAFEDPIVAGLIRIPATVVTNVEGTIRHDLKNSNRLVTDYNYTGVIGGKTGFTHGAGHCLISAAERDGLKLIAVVLSTYAESKEASALEARKLLDWGFSNVSLE